MFTRDLRRLSAPLLRFLAKLFIKAQISADQITLTALLLGLVSALLCIANLWAWSAGVWLFASSLDALDGAVARESGTARLEGAFLDSLTDKVTEASLLCALGWSIPRLMPPAMIAAVGFLLSGYASKGAQLAGIKRPSGAVERPERALLLGAILLLIHWDALELVFWLLSGLALMNLLTFSQRFWKVVRSPQFREKSP